jgi:hypothetical protein
MSVGGSKLRWCPCSAPITLLQTINNINYRVGSYRRHHRVSTASDPRVWVKLSFQIGVGVIMAWGRTIYKQFELLAGKSAPHEFLQFIIYKAATFNDQIDKIDTVRAYHVCLQCLPFVFLSCLSFPLFRVDQCVSSRG